MVEHIFAAIGVFVVVSWVGMFGVFVALWRSEKRVDEAHLRREWF